MIKKSILQLLAFLHGVTVCELCGFNKIDVYFSYEHICLSCFRKKYGGVVLSTSTGEYYGGHKLYVAGGKFKDHELGWMFLTDKYFIFLKSNKDPRENWQIIIPLESVLTDHWHIQEESRRKNMVFGGVGYDNIMIAQGMLRESGKRHRLVITYKDENGIINSPVFGVSSVSGQAIREWTTALYNALAITKNDNAKDKTDTINNNEPDPLSILKLRFAKGDINKQDYEEMKKILEKD